MRFVMNGIFKINDNEEKEYVFSKKKKWIRLSKDKIGFKPITWTKDKAKINYYLFSDWFLYKEQEEKKIYEQIKI